MDKRLEKIENYIRQYHMIEKGDRIVIGVSGGADSVCLLMALWSLQEKLGFQVLVCHVNHELRGEEAAQDEAYVEMLCHKMQVPFFAFHENVELIAKKRKESLEEDMCEDRHLNNSVENRAGQRLQQRIIVMTMQKQCFLIWQEEPGFADCVG